MRRVYLDHAATTPVDPRVAEVALECMTGNYGNPSSLHQFGRLARQAVETAREQVAGLIGAAAKEVVFLSGGTEGDNLAIKGVAAALKKRGNHIITSAIEHHAVLHMCEYLEGAGCRVTYLPVDEHGLVRLSDVEAALTKETVLVTIMLGNNEVGTIQPIADIARLTRARGIVLHTDAVQATAQVPVNVDALGVDLLTISGHKMYGPKGIGALYIRRGTRLVPQALGGGHEHKLRAGTENVPGIAALGKAAELARAELAERGRHLSALRDRFLDGIMERIPDVKLNGHPERRLPNNANLSFKYVEGEALLLNLDMRGIAVSSGSACTSGSLEPSHVLLAMGVPPEVAQGSLRFTFGRQNTDDDVDYVLQELPPVVAKLREMSPFTPPQEEGGADVH